MPKKKKIDKMKKPQAYDTYALANEAYRDKDTNARRPEEDDAVRMRHWSEENKL